MTIRKARPGDFLRVDDRSGFRVPASETRKEWNGAIVDRKSYESRHPQDYVRARVDNQRVPDPRPRPVDVFQVPAGGPFIFVQRDNDERTVWNVEDGDVFIHAGVAALTPADL
jgi:hypothetical protein